MSLKDKLLGTSKVSRRDFLKGVSAAGVTAAVYGCGGGDGAKTYMEEDEETRLNPPAITEATVMGATPHNCGGRCVSKYYVKDGVVKRIVTDERPDLGLDEGDDPQYRSCVRCRSRKQWFYRNDRILYPLKQTGARGDVDGFVRISWDQAFSEIAAKMADVKSRYGNKGMHSIYASGDASGWCRNAANTLLALYGGYTYYYSNYSFPALEHVGRFVDGKDNGAPYGNGRQDAKNADYLVLWSFNPNETVFGTNTNWYLQQIKEKGVPVIAIDTRVSKTVVTAADEYISIIPGTDAALLLGMMYHILKNNFDLVDVDFINKYCYGFFDNGNSILHDTVDAANYGVPDGGSLSAFIMGDETDLVTAGLNNATSIYPNTIGYNVNTDDDLYGKTVHTWGQMAKTPEWAEKITGISAARIRELAEMYMNNNITTWIGGGYQRNTESEQAVWLNRIFSVFSKNFGASGCSSGRNSNNVTASTPGVGLSASNAVNLESEIYDATRVTSPLTYVHNVQRANLPVFVIPDAVDNAGTGKSKWNDGQVKHIHEGFGKIIFNPGGNIMVNQSGDVNYNMEIFKDKSKCEMIVNFDHFLTPTAAISDYILPSTMQGEKPGAVNAWGTGEVCIRLNKVTDVPGEVMDEYSICAGIADKLGLKSDYLGSYAEGQQGMDDRLRDGWESSNLTAKYGMTYDEWVDTGVASLHSTYTENDYNIYFKAFRMDPEANPLQTPTGKFEAYCQAMMEDYEARYHENADTVTSDDGGMNTLYNGGTVYSRYYGATPSRRFVYPIPMYIPLIEGRHAVDYVDENHMFAHDDPLGLRDKGYNFTLHTWHTMYRSHSTLNNVAYLDECHKKDIYGNEAYLNPDREWTDGVWDENVYEQLWMNPTDAVDLGVQTGDRILVSNDRGKMYASVVITNRVRPKIVHIGQGSWAKQNANGIDIGGCANTVVTARPSRICKGMTSANDSRVKIVKA
jgi:anaerobic dimethyl sulfoxide reductase subunit A